MKSAAFLIICFIAASPGLPALAQTAASQEADVAALVKEVRELRKQLEEQQHQHDAQIQELHQQINDLSKGQQTPASQPTQAQPLPRLLQQAVQPAAQTQPSGAQELSAAIAEAQAAQSPPAEPNQPPSWANLLSFNQPAAPVQSFNPDISLVGDFLARHDSDQGGVLSDSRIVRELELGIAGNIDPYARFTGIFSVHPKEDANSGYDIDVEEAYVEPLSPICDSVGGKLGKFRVNFGKINDYHEHALPWPEYPLVIQNFFGEEGLEGEGVSVSWLAPTDKFIEITSQSITKSSDTLFGGDDSDNFVQVLHLKTFNDLTDTSTLEWGLSGGVLPNSDTPGTNNVFVEGTDFTYKWRPRRKVCTGRSDGLRSFWRRNGMPTTSRSPPGACTPPPNINSPSVGR